MIHHPKIEALLFAVMVGFVFTVPLPAASNAYQGYVFCASGYNAYLLDPSGRTVHTWRATSSARSYAHLLPDGSALFPISTSCTVRGDGAYPHGRVQKISWDGQIVWDAVICDATYTPGYTIEPMPNGNFLVAGASNTGGLKIVEIQPSGSSGHTKVWEYDLPDSLGRSGYINSVSYNPELNYVGIDINQQKKLVVINKATKSIVYTYAVTSGTATHGAMWVTKYYLGTNIVMPDADTAAMRVNNFMVVNNSTQVVEVNPVTRRFVKNIPFRYSAHEGSVQRLPNGNTLVNAASSTVVELSDDGTQIRTITLPGRVARAYMYGPAYPGLKDYTRITTAVPKPTAAGKFSYNAATGMLKVALDNPDNAPLFLRIVTLNGKTVFSSASRGSTASISTGTLGPGVYYVEAHRSRGYEKDGAAGIRHGFVKTQ
ncbi:MAG: hypothetical protein JXA71_15705 [Chitinispirillaceae bacterium]|nr:hypothetical protein [Chitinispirillaceae bacterium]